MPFDTTLPVDHSPIVAAELRNQFNGLNDILTAFPSMSDIYDVIVPNCAANANGVATLGLTVSNPPTQAEVQAIADKLDELINALRR